MFRLSCSFFVAITTIWEVPALPAGLAGDIPNLRSTRSGNVERPLWANFGTPTPWNLLPPRHTNCVCVCAQQVWLFSMVGPCMCRQEDSQEGFVNGAVVTNTSLGDSAHRRKMEGLWHDIPGSHLAGVETPTSGCIVLPGRR